MKKTKARIASILSFEANEAELRTQLSHKNMDWEWFVKTSSHHGVLTSAYCRLKQKGLLDVMPEDLKDYLKKLTVINRNRNKTLLHQVQELSKLFNSHGIQHVFVKGCALLAAGYYKDYGERLIGDIDVLVEPNHLLKAEQVLKEVGYNSLGETLFGKYKKHRHLPRLIHHNSLGAVEIHSKLLRKEVPKILNVKQILGNRKTINGVCVPTPKANLNILILNHQINDFGHVFKFINFKACYDSLVLEQLQEQSTNEVSSKYHRLFYTLRALYFNFDTKDSKNTTSIMVKTIYKYLNQNRVVQRIHIRLVKFNIGLITCVEGLKLFVKNKHFRVDVWNHKSEVVKLLRGEI